jgi:hypothetical protein
MGKKGRGRNIRNAGEVQANCKKLSAKYNM